MKRSHSRESWPLDKRVPQERTAFYKAWSKRHGAKRCAFRLHLKKQRQRDRSLERGDDA